MSKYESYEIPSLRRPFHWPRSVRLTLESIIAVFVNAYQIARGRAVGSPSSAVRLLAERDDALTRAAIAERKVELFRRRLWNVSPLNRPDFVPDDRFEILKIMWYRGWSIGETAEHFVLHRNTVSEWLRRYRSTGDLRGFLGRGPVNRIGDATRWLVHEMRRLGIRFGTGTRTIAAMIVDAGIKLSRTSVQRILREQKPERPRSPGAAGGWNRRTPLHVLHPRKANRTWHLDLTALTAHGMRFHVAALLDGFLRRRRRTRCRLSSPRLLEARHVDQGVQPNTDRHDDVGVGEANGESGRMCATLHRHRPRHAVPQAFRGDA
jgi:transposase